MIGKSRQPRCFYKLKPSKLPVDYKAYKKALMTNLIMQEWLPNLDKSIGKKQRKILLFSDNAPSHPSGTLKNVKVVFLPANTTSLLQPMDQGIIQTMKLKYRKREYRKRQLRHMAAGRTGLMVRASDSGSGDPGSILGRVGVFVSLSKRHLLPKSTGNTQE